MVKATAEATHRLVHRHFRPARRGMLAGIARSTLFVAAILSALQVYAGSAFAGASSTAPSVSAPTTHWAFQPIQHPPVPILDTATNGSRSINPIDAFLLARRDGHPFSPPADRRTLLRRLTYDLTGLPPSPEAIEQFAADSSSNAVSHAIERLLASPHYGEQWGRHWLDVVRYADTAGENTDHPLPEAWRYRNWVLQSFNQDKPYDEFIQEQIAGDLLAAEGSPEKYADRIIATGYLAIARRFGHDIDKDQHLTLEDTIDTLGKSVLGLTLACARCHDHKNDPISARDYYGLYGIFESTRFAFPGCEPSQMPHDLVPLWAPQEVSARRQPFLEERARLERVIQEANSAQSNQLQSVRAKITNSVHLLARGEFNDGGAQNLTTNDATLRVEVRMGDLIQLTVFPRANYGADTTIIDLNVSEEGASGRHWKLAEDVTADFLAGNPHADSLGHSNVWCFLDPRNGMQLLPESVRDHEGHRGLDVWRNGENPSAFVNATDQPIKVWTTLPPRTLFVHPAPDGPVAVAWLSPVTGSVRIGGRVADGHAGGGDGVAWRLEHYSADFGSDLPALATLASRLRRPKAALTALAAREPSVPVAYAVTEGRVRNTRLQKRGDPEQLGPEVPRKFPDVLGGQLIATTNQSGRLELARWLTNPTNPLTARVMVNRIWLGHFGRGLVSTPNDFGRQGQPPTHPDLLDWLASEFIRSGWSIKALHRIILNSAAYQQSANENSTPGDDAGPYGAFARRRLTAEELRDTLLAVTGELDRTIGEAHPFPPAEKWSFTQHGPFAAEYETTRRSVYVMQKRNRRIPFFAMFDGPDPNASTALRDVTTVPTQALYFMNDPFVHARSEVLAKKVLAQAHDDASRARLVCRDLLGREATDVEVSDAAEFVRDYATRCAREAPARRETLAWSAWTRVILASNEFLYLD